MTPLTRRQFIASSGAALAIATQVAPAVGITHDLESRIQGLMYGGAIGDALGGPIEFQPPDKVHALKNPPKLWREGEKLDRAAREATLARLHLRSYHDLRPGTESYGQWNPDSTPGTITDDTRHKLVLLHALHEADRHRRWPVTVKDLARAYIEWPKTRAVVGRAGYPALAEDWLNEWQLGGRWVLGERKLTKAFPPERMWQGLATCSGQMTLLPLAAMFAGRPEQAYRAAYGLAYFDNGIGKDLNAALVAGLSQALVIPSRTGSDRATFEPILKTMRETDPLQFRKIRWTERAVDRWLNLSLRLGQAAEGEPARLFASLEKEFAQTTKWEAQVPFVVTFACLELSGYDPLVALQLSMEWGHDTDSYAQLVGSFIGALHGSELFRPEWRNAVESGLLRDHGTDLQGEGRFLARLQQQGQKRALIAGV